MNRRGFACGLAAAALLFPVFAHASPSINGAGSTAAAPIYRVWSQNYERVSKTALNYDAIGSSAGLARIRERKADFGASDVPPSTADLEKDGLIMVPTVVTAAVPIINVPGVGRGQLRLTGEVLARIFLGQVTAWNAPEIRELNPRIDLPAAPIRVVVRADGSGTTYHFADFLSKVSAEWASARGAKSSFPWPGSFVAVKGSAEVAKSVKTTPGAIGYVDYNYVIEGDLDFAQLRNAAGNFVSPSVDSFVAAVRASDWYTKGDFKRGLNNMPGAASWPITMGTFAILPHVSTTPDNTVAALRFLTWGYLNGDNLAKQANFVPLPERVQAKAYAEISKIVDGSGNPLGARAMSAPGAKLKSFQDVLLSSVGVQN
jgi:phosphate transport system substrate-binding protein